MHFGSLSFGTSDQQKSSVDKAKNTSNSRIDVDSLQQELERVLIINQALWEILRDTNKLNEDLLFQKIIEIDGRDGRIDGKVAKLPARHCTKCNHILPRDKQFCFYCGQLYSKDSFER